MEVSSYFIILLVLLVLSALFSAAETSFTAISDIKFNKLAGENPRNFKYLEKLLKQPGKMLTTILVGNNIVNILSSIISTIIFMKILIGLGSHNIAANTLIITLIMTTLILIFGEITPKTIAIRNPEKISLHSSRFIYVVSILFYPIIRVLNLISKLVIRLTGGTKLDKGTLVTEEEIKILINMGRKEGVLEEDEEKMLNSIIEFGDIIVREIMTPRTDIVAVEEYTSPRKVVDLIRRDGHSRIPVYKEKIDNITGLIYAKDLLSVPEEELEKASFLKDLLREPYFVPETKKIDEVLSEMRAKKKHLAIVVDEYGGTSGLVTIEDILEEIVGDIKDEYDAKEEPIIKLSEAEYIISGTINVSELNEQLAINLPVEEDYDTIAGFIVNRLGQIPKVGDVVEYEDLILKVTDARRRRILQIEMEIIKDRKEQ